MDKTEHKPVEATEPPVDPLRDYELKARMYMHHEGEDADKGVVVTGKQQTVNGLVPARFTVPAWRLTAASLRKHDLFNSVLYADPPVQVMFSQVDDADAVTPLGGGADGAAIAGVGQ